jgi:hypothetical protein
MKGAQHLHSTLSLAPRHRGGLCSQLRLFSLFLLGSSHPAASLIRKSKERSPEPDRPMEQRTNISVFG